MLDRRRHRNTATTPSTVMMWTRMLMVAAVAIATSVIISSSVVAALASPIPRLVGRAIFISASTRLSLAYGLPDEELELPRDNDDDDRDQKDEKSSVADDTLASLSKKFDKSETSASKSSKTKQKDNKSMAFLKQIGRVGGAANKNFVNAVGSDEGSTGRQPAVARNVNVNSSGSSKDGSGGKKAREAYIECTTSGVVDDVCEPFPSTSSGREWRGITDRVMGGLSNGILRRELDLQGRPANVLTGHVSLDNNGGFLQMVTDLALDASQNAVDASEYDGVEVDLLYRNVNEDDNNGEHGDGTYNLHLRTPGTFQQASYRHTFTLEEPDEWETLRIPFDAFTAYAGKGDNAETTSMPPTIDPAELRRIGIVAIGREADVFLAMGGLRFYNVI